MEEHSNMQKVKELNTYQKNENNQNIFYNEKQEKTIDKSNKPQYAIEYCEEKYELSRQKHFAVFTF